MIQAEIGTLKTTSWGPLASRSSNIVPAPICLRGMDTILNLIVSDSRKQTFCPFVGEEVLEMGLQQVATPAAVPFGEWWKSLWQWLTRCQLPQTGGEKALAIVAGAILLLILIALFGVRLFGAYPVLGHSMEPTLPYVGGYYVLDTPTKAASPGDLVALDNRSALGRSFKRVREITPQGVVVVGDNVDRSMDSEYGIRTDGQVATIPFSDVRRVRDIWSPERLIRCFTEQGRVQNWKQFAFAPSSVIEGEGELFVVKRESEALMFEGRKTVSTLKFAQSDAITQQDGRFLVCRYEAGMPVRYTWTQSGLANRQLVGNVGLPAVPTGDEIALSSEQGDLVLTTKVPFTKVEITIADSPIRVYVISGDKAIEARRMAESGPKLASLPLTSEIRIIGVRPADYGEIPESGLTGVRVY